MLTFNHEPLGKIGIATRFIKFRSRKPKRILTIIKQHQFLRRYIDTTNTTNLPASLNTRNNRSNITLTSLRDTLVEEIFRDGPAPGFFLDEVEL
jgi:hypothetical protein